MTLLLDENLPKKLKFDFPEYEIFTIRDKDWNNRKTENCLKWANGLEGGFVYGRDAVREYWTDQFKAIQPSLRPENSRRTKTIGTLSPFIKSSKICRAMYWRT
jgi:hypothetical protein